MKVKISILNTLINVKMDNILIFVKEMAIKIGLIENNKNIAEKVTVYIVGNIFRCFRKAVRI